MQATKLMSVKCGGCGQVYHVPRPAVDQRAKCRPCGHEFLIPASPAVLCDKNQGSTRPGQAAADRFTAAQIAAASSQKRGMRLWSTRSISKIAIGIAGVVLFAVIGYTGWLWPVHAVDAAMQMQRGRVAKLSAPRSEFEYASVAELIEAVEPSVVQIETPGGIGSGFVLDASGLIVTCFHCTDGATSGEVVFANGRRVPIVRVAMIAPERDVAIIEIKSAKPLVALPLADRLPKKGDPIVAVGSPAGLSFSISEGSVSGLRTVQDLDDLTKIVQLPTDLSPTVMLVQITASMMPGNSGGPVVDFSGNVVGISSFLLNYHGHVYEFCISAEEIRQVVADFGKQ